MFGHKRRNKNNYLKIVSKMTYIVISLVNVNFSFIEEQGLLGIM